MKITNKKERKFAMLRFTGLYLLGLAIPIFIIVSSLTVRTVDSKDSAETLSLLRKRDEAVKEVYQLSAKLIEMQRLRQTEKYDEMRLQFEKSVDALQKKFLADTVTYATSYELASLLRNFHKEFDKNGTEFKNTVEEYARQVVHVRDSAGAIIKELQSAGSGSAGDLAEAKLKAAAAENENKALAREKNAADKAQEQCAKQLDKLTEKCRSCADAVESINTSLNEIESKAKDITKAIFSGNKDIKKSILSEVTSIRNNANKVKKAIAP